MRMTLDWEDACELLDAAVEDRVVGTWRWGHIQEFIVKKDDKFWRTTIRVHSQDGWQDEDTVDFEEVVEKEVLQKVWVKV